MKNKSSSINDRNIQLGPGLAAIHERLLLQHARGEVLFIVGAGASKQANVPDFRGLVLKVYEEVDVKVHSILEGIPGDACTKCFIDTSDLKPEQSAEVNRFVLGEYDVVLGMLERRFDGEPAISIKVRNTVENVLKNSAKKSAEIHRSLMKLADRGPVLTIATTNFEQLLEKSVRGALSKFGSYSLDAIPRPTRRNDFCGVLHIHGAFDDRNQQSGNYLLTDRDFGEYYLRRRTVPDFIYDAARLYNLVLVGYSANDPPMKYLLNAVAADGTRFEDLKERYAFVGVHSSDPVLVEDWKGRGITPITYDSAGNHSKLTKTLSLWSIISPINAGSKKVDSEINRIIKTNRVDSLDSDKDLFDHFVRRGDINEKNRITEMIRDKKADLGWFNAIIDVLSEKDKN